jgi:hypothetical protein
MIFKLAIIKNILKRFKNKHRDIPREKHKDKETKIIEN